MKAFLKKVPGFRTGSRPNQVMATVYYILVIALYGSMSIVNLSFSTLLGGGFILLMPYLVFRMFNRADASDKAEIEAKKSKIK